MCFLEEPAKYLKNYKYRDSSEVLNYDNPVSLYVSSQLTLVSKRVFSFVFMPCTELQYWKLHALTVGAEAAVLFQPS